MLLNLYGIEKMVQVLAEHNNLRVVFEDIVMPRTDGKTLYVPKPELSWDEDMVVKWLYYIYHELGHNKVATRDTFPFLKEKKISTLIQNPDGTYTPVFFGMMLNLLDDFRQEYHEYDKYEGQRKTMSLGRYLHYSPGIANYGKDIENKEQEAMESMFAWDCMCRNDWQPNIIGMQDAIYNKITSQSKEWYNKLCRGNYESVLKNASSIQDLYELQIRILKEVFEFDPDEKEKESRSRAEEKSEETKEGESTEEEAGEDDKEGRGKEEKTKYKVIRWEHLIHHIHEGDETKRKGMGMDIDFADYRPTGITYSPTPVNDIKIYDMTKGDRIEHGFENKSLVDRMLRDIKELDSGHGLSNKVKRLLQIRSRDSYQYGMKTGKLHNKNLYRVGIKNAKGFNERVFKNKKINNTLDISVSVLCDFSASMRGSKFLHQAKATALLHDCLKTLRVPYEIIGFTENMTGGHKGAEHIIFKSFTSSTTEEKLLKDFSMMSQVMHQNADGEHILWTYNRIKSQPTKRKIMFVLSDGAPCCDRDGDVVQFTKQVIRGIEKEEVVEIYALGMLYNAVKYFYSNYVVVKNVQELEEKLLEVVKSRILN